MSHLEIDGIGLIEYTPENLGNVKEMIRRIRAGEAVDKIPVSIPRAIETLKKAFKEDPQYKIGWIANIAMAMYDELNSRPGVLPHQDMEVFNKGAERFLDLLCR